MSVLLITHNFGIVAEICDRVSVMYAGKVVETCDTKTIFRDAAHPYSRALIASIPKTGMNVEYLPTIPGSPPELYGENKACAYLPRCSYRDNRCLQAPEMKSCGVGHLAACHHLQAQEAEKD